MEWSGGIAFPGDAIVVYSLRSFFLIIFWIGILLFLVARDPVANSQAALVLAGMCLSAAVLCLVLGIRYGLPYFFYFDVLSSLVLGALLLAYRARAAAG